MRERRPLEVPEPYREPPRFILGVFATLLFLAALGLLVFGMGVVW